MRLLIVDDETEIADSLVKGLKKQDFAVDVAYSGEEALEKVSLTDYDLICLDVSMPGMSGIEVCQQIRKEQNLEKAPRILMLTALSQIEDRVTGLDVGADDYLVKPFDFAELLARVRALLRRDTDTSSKIVRLGDLELDLKKHTATCKEKEVRLTSKEYSVLRFFMSHPGEVFSQEQLLEHNWDGNSDPFTHTVRVTLSNLRRKLEEVTKGIEIETIVGEGYRLNEVKQNGG